MASFSISLQNRLFLSSKELLPDGIKDVLATMFCMNLGIRCDFLHRTKNDIRSIFFASFGAKRTVFYQWFPKVNIRFEVLNMFYHCFERHDDQNGK